MAGGGRLLFLSRNLRSSLGSTNWHNLGKFASGGNPQQEVHWNNLKGFDSSVSAVIENAKHEPEPVDWAKWEDRISHKNILSHMKKTYTNTMETLDRALGELEQPKYLKEGWENYEEAKKRCSEATKAADKIISDGIKALWISQHNPPTWKVDTNEWLESDQYWQAFVEKHAMYSQSGTSNDPESPSEVEAVKNKWNVNMFKFNERTDTPMLYDYMYHNPAWEYYDIYRKQFFEHMEYFLLRTGEDFRNFPDVPKWKWLTHIEDLRFKQFSVENRRKFNKQLKKMSRFEKTDLGAGEHENEEEVNMQTLLEEKTNLEEVMAKLLGGYGFLVEPLVPVENEFQFKYVLSRDNYKEHKKTKLYTLGEDLPYLYVLPHTSELTESGRVGQRESFTQDPLTCFYNMMDYMNLSGVKVNPSYATRLQLKCEVMYERGPNWLKLEWERTREAFMRRLRYDDPLKGEYEEYVEELKRRMSGAKEVDPEDWKKSFEKLERTRKDLGESLRAEGKPPEYSKEELREMVANCNVVVKDEGGRKVREDVALRELA